MSLANLREYLNCAQLALKTINDSEQSDHIQFVISIGEDIRTQLPARGLAIFDESGISLCPLKIGDEVYPIVKSAGKWEVLEFPAYDDVPNPRQVIGFCVLVTPEVRSVRVLIEADLWSEPDVPEQGLPLEDILTSREEALRECEERNGGS